MQPTHSARAMNSVSSDDLLTEAIDKLVQEFHPERIYLFGSRARGDHRPDSDYDLMVIVSDDTPAEKAELSFVNRILWETRLSRDVKIITRASFNRQLHLKASMPSTVLRQGVLLYQSGEWAPPTELEHGRILVREQTEHEYNPVHLENTREWVKLARVDLLAAEFNLQGPDALRGYVMFHCQQAVEKACKALIHWYDRPVARSHVLNNLIAELIQVDSAFEILRSRATPLDRWDIRGRYSGASPGKDEAEAALQLSRSIVDDLFQRLLPEVLSDNAETGGT